MNPQNGEPAGLLLIVDDEPTFLLSTSELLRRNGYQVHAAKDSLEALDLMALHRYDALISDIIMPGNTGLEFIHKATRIDPHLFVILVTAYPALPTAIRAINLPVDAYLVKPVDFQEFLEAVRQAVRKSQVQRVLGASQERIEQWNRKLKQVRSRAHTGMRDGSQIAAVDFLRLAVGNMAGTLLDLETMLDLVHPPAEGIPHCSIERCPRLAHCKEVIGGCVEVLDATKSAFKSRSLAQVRVKLEQLLRG